MSIDIVKVSSQEHPSTPDSAQATRRSMSSSGPRRSPTLQFLPNLHVPLPVHPVDVITSPPTPPRNASGVILLLRHIEYCANIVNLGAGDINLTTGSRDFFVKRRTLRSVRRALTGTKGFNETTIAPSFKSRNFGRIDSFTGNQIIRDDTDRNNIYSRDSLNTLLLINTTSASLINFATLSLFSMSPSSSSTSPMFTPHIRARVFSWSS